MHHDRALQVVFKIKPVIRHWHALLSAGGQLLADVIPGPREALSRRVMNPQGARQSLTHPHRKEDDCSLYHGTLQ
jgi:hypothetical protein